MNSKMSLQFDDNECFTEIIFIQKAESQVPARCGLFAFVVCKAWEGERALILIKFKKCLNFNAQLC